MGNTPLSWGDKGVLFMINCGWGEGCCLSGEVGFTDDRIVVVLTGAEPDDEDGNQDGLALQADPGAHARFAAVDATVRAALGGPAG